MARQIVRVGFDFDGVIAYNPLRIFRRPAMWSINLLRRKKGKLHYPVPSSHPNRLLWAALHETSFFPSYGFGDLKKMLEERKIKAYLITGRYSFLKGALLRWLRYRKIDHLFEELYLNDKNEQPHLYKERVINKLGLDIFVEDNWDIVHYLNKQYRKKEGKPIEIHWIYNLLDRNVEYPHKHPYMKSFIAYLRENKIS